MDEPPLSPSTDPPPPLYPVAPTYKLPKTSHYNSIETPFPIKSLPHVLSLLSGPLPPTLQSHAQTQRERQARTNIDGLFNRQTRSLEMWTATEEEERIGESRWRHPLMGEGVDVGRLLLKIKRRRRKVREGNNGVADASHQDRRKGKGKARPEHNIQNGNERISTSTATEKNDERGGIFKAEIIGVISRTVRFKAMADYQYTPNQNDTIPKLVKSLYAADAKAILDFEFPPLNETYYVPIDSSSPSSSTDPTNPSVDISTRIGDKHTRIWADDDIKFKSIVNVLPPPIFSRQVIFHNFSYQANPATKPTTVKDPITGATEIRLYNTMRGKATALKGVRFDEPGPVPAGPDDEVLKGAEYLDQALLELLKEKMQQRPMWSRQALINQFEPEHQKTLESKKAYFPLSAWTYVDGPFRDNLVRFGYDPRADRESYIYQRIYFRSYRPEDSGVRNVMRRIVDTEYEGREGRGAKGKDSEQTRKRAATDGTGFVVDSNKGHIFDGQVLHRDVANYQLVDITDPLLSELIHDPRARKDHIDGSSGWFYHKQFDTIKSILRRKWLAMSEGGTCTDDECDDLVKEFQDFDSSKSPSRQVSRMRSVEANDEEETTRPESSTPTVIQKKGRPKGGGGYAAGTVPTGTTVRGSLPRTERWKRKGTAYIPLAEEEQAALRLERALEREERQLRHATMRVALEDMENGDDEDVEGVEEGEGGENEEAGDDIDEGGETENDDT